MQNLDVISVDRQITAIQPACIAPFAFCKCRIGIHKRTLGHSRLADLPRSNRTYDQHGRDSHNQQERFDIETRRIA